MYALKIMYKLGSIYLATGRAPCYNHAMDYVHSIVVASGGFDPLHVGHVRYLQSASLLGARLLVALNTDEWLIQKKGYAFMPKDERREILLSLACVWSVSLCYSPVEVLSMYPGCIFAKGGDRDIASLPQEEIDICSALNIRIVDGVGGRNKLQSSSLLVARQKILDRREG